MTFKSHSFQISSQIKFVYMCTPKVLQDKIWEVRKIPEKRQQISNCSRSRYCFGVLSENSENYRMSVKLTPSAELIGLSFWGHSQESNSHFTLHFINLQFRFILFWCKNISTKLHANVGEIDYMSTSISSWGFVGKKLSNVYLALIKMKHSFKITQMKDNILLISNWDNIVQTR